MEILVLGAEKQAATSLALAYPEHRFRFATDQAIVDGWDLPNVAIVRATPGGDIEGRQTFDRVVALCPRWLAPDAVERASLPRSIETLARAMPDMVLPVQPKPGDIGAWIVKGARWHRPDNPMTGDVEALDGVVDTHGCGLVYQRLTPDVGATLLAVGYRAEAGRVAIGVLRVIGEVAEREAFLIAAETTDAPTILEASLDALDALDHHGFFSLNWVVSVERPLLTSFRPAPRAVFTTFRRAGIDLLAAPVARHVAPGGFRFVGMPSYASFESLDA